jgi:hypothetical protein
LAAITGTANQVVSTPGAGSITLSLPQNIHTAATPTFADLTLSAPVNIYALNHDSFAGFVADKHVAHTGVSILAGTGMSGGGDISVSRTLTCTITQYTDALARAAISETVTGLDYSNTTGVLSLTAGYVIPTTTQETNWGTAYTHVSSTGDDHTWLNQDVTTKSSPTFLGETLSESLVTIDSYTKLLLHFDGVDASTRISDNSFSGHTPTVVANAQIDTTQSKFGGSSCLFDGTDDYVTVPASADFNFAAGDFTIDCWFYFTTAGRKAIFAFNTDTRFGLDYNSVGTTKLGLWASSNGSSWDLIHSDAGGNGICAATPPLNQWNHVAVVRNGNNWRVYLNGIVDLDIIVAGTITNNSGEAFNVGRWGYSANHFWYGGWIDEFRISKGIARWTAAFTPPTKSYGDATFGRIGIGYETTKNGGLAVKEWFGLGTDTPLRKLHLYDPHGSAEMLCERGDQGVDQKRFNIFIANNSTFFRALNDAGDGGINWLQAYHSTGNIIFGGDIALNAGKNINLSTTTGTKIGSATNQLLGFYNATPVDQPATVTDPAGGLVIDTEARTAINTIIDRLQELGLIA